MSKDSLSSGIVSILAGGLMFVALAYKFDILLTGTLRTKILASGLVILGSLGTYWFCEKIMSGDK